MGYNQCFTYLNTLENLKLPMDSNHAMDRKIKKNFWTSKRLIGYAVGVVIVGLSLAAIFRDAGTSRMNVASDRLMLDTINNGVFKEYITVFGAVEPIKSVFLDAVESGRVEEVYLESGTNVEKGQGIIKLSNRDLQLNVLNQEAQVIAQINNLRNLSVMMDQQTLNLKELALDIEFQIDLLDKRTKRNKALIEEKVIPQVEYEETRDEYEHLLRRRKLMKQTLQKDSLSQELQKDQMESSLSLMQRNLDFARQSLNSLKVEAPIDGQLSSLNLELGQMITRGERIAQIDVLDDFKIRANIDEFYINRISLGLEASLSFDGKSYDLVVRRIYPEVVNGSFEVDLLFKEKRPENIKRGQTLSIKLSLSAESQALLLAKGGHYQTTGGQWIYVLNPNNGTAYKREIAIGRQNPNYYEVREGLYEGDIVIISSYEHYGDKDELVLK